MGRSWRQHISPNRLFASGSDAFFRCGLDVRGIGIGSVTISGLRSSVHRSLCRYQRPRLARLDRAPGLPVRTLTSIHYDKSAPGKLVHVRFKTFGRILDGSHRKLAVAGRKNNGYGNRGRG